tara:strand:- start:680 stop:1078 length:399 start_codon:yes stop_codon:yes gene_type:complete
LTLSCGITRGLRGHGEAHAERELRVLCRYKKARALGKDFFQRAVEEDQELLGALGLGLLSVDNGLRVILKDSIRGERVNPWDVIEVSPRLWGWLRPLLLELMKLRAAQGLNSAKINGVEVNGAAPRETLARP